MSDRFHGFDRKVSKSLLYENVMKKIVEMIDRGIVKPGEQFPTERELVDDMGVSRNVLREAFHILEEKGIISSVQGKGRFLRSVPSLRIEKPTALELQKHSLLEIYQVRTILELGVLDILVEQATPRDIEELENVHRELAQQFTETQSTQGEFKMHMAYAERSGNYYLHALLQETIDRVLRIMWDDFPRIAQTYEIRYFIEDHARIIQAIKDRDTEEARNRMKTHLSRTSHEVGVFPSQE